MEPYSTAELFPHVRVVMGTIIGLGITRLLMTVAGLVQHPRRARPSMLHLLWVGSILLELILWWWWEIALFRIEGWNFAIVLFLIGYAICLFMLAALLTPDNVAEYAGYEDFFLQRRRWFFGILAATFVFDFVDTMLKGQRHLQLFDWSYAIQIPFGLVLCAVAWRSSSHRMQLTAVLIHIAYQLFLVGRFFHTVS